MRLTYMRLLLSIGFLLSVHASTSHQAGEAGEAAEQLPHGRQLAAFGGGSRGGGFGGSSFRPSGGSSFRPPAGGTVTGYPAGTVTGVPVRPAGPAAGAARPGAPPAVTRPPPGYPPAPAGRAYGATALPGGFRSYGRPGFLSSPFVLPFATGLLAATALSSLNRDPNAYCNGRTIVCYKQACQQALASKCPAASTNATLVLSGCPDSRYSECYRTANFNNTAVASFECFGVRRPRYGQEDLAAVCHTPEGTSASGGRTNAAQGSSGSRASKVLRIALGAGAATLLLAWW